MLPTRLIALAILGWSADELQTRLRRADPPIIARVQQDRVVLDLRTVFVEQDEALIAAVHALVT